MKNRKIKNEKIPSLLLYYYYYYYYYYIYPSNISKYLIKIKEKIEREREYLLFRFVHNLQRIENNKNKTKQSE